MQKNNKVSLNAVRVFEAVVRHGSLKNAATEQHVSASAVSHQIKSLEQTLGIKLFERKNNSVMLTTQGQRFYAEVQPAITSILNAIGRLSSLANTLVIKVSLSFAVRWLIPQLEDFKQCYPQISVRLETTHYSDFDLTPGIDLAVTYRQNNSTKSTGRLILKEDCQPLISPKLLLNYKYSEYKDCLKIPAVSSNSSNWDWQIWEKSTGLKSGSISIVDQFDTDDTAIHAAVSGLGMVLTSDFMAKKELANGQLIMLPGTEVINLGGYWLTSSGSTAAVLQFESWILKTLKHKK